MLTHEDAMRLALRKCVEAMRLQRQRMNGEAHLSAEAMTDLWDDALAKADVMLATPSELPAPQQERCEFGCGQPLSAHVHPGSCPATLPTETGFDAWWAQKLSLNLVHPKTAARVAYDAAQAAVWDSAVRVAEERIAKGSSWSSLQAIDGARAVLDALRTAHARRETNG